MREVNIDAIADLNKFKKISLRGVFKLHKFVRRFVTIRQIFQNLI